MKNSELLKHIRNEYKVLKYQTVKYDAKGYSILSIKDIFNSLINVFRSKQYKCKLIDTDISVTDLRILLDSNEYDIVYFDTVSSMSKYCATMIREFLYLYKRESNRQMCTVTLRHSTRHEGYKANDILELHTTDINEEHPNFDFSTKLWLD